MFPGTIETIPHPYDTQKTCITSQQQQKKKSWNTEINGNIIQIKNSI